MNTTQTKHRIEHTPLPYRVAYGAYGAYGAVYAGEERILLADRGNENTSPVERERNIEFAALACNWHYEAREALIEIALICEHANDNTNWQDILRRANSALEGLRKAEGRTQQ